MANDAVFLVNPTHTDITVSAQTVKAGRLARLTVADTTTDLYSFVCQGCVVAPASKTNGTANIADTLSDLATLVKRGAQTLDETAQAAVSAGVDSHALAGL